MKNKNPSATNPVTDGKKQHSNAPMRLICDAQMLKPLSFLIVRKNLRYKE